MRCAAFIVPLSYMVGVKIDIGAVQINLLSPNFLSQKLYENKSRPAVLKM